MTSRAATPAALDGPTTTRSTGLSKRFVVTFNQDIDALLNGMAGDAGELRNVLASQLERLLSARLGLAAGELTVGGIAGRRVYFVLAAPLTGARQEKLQQAIAAGQLLFTFQPPASADAAPIVLAATSFDGDAAPSKEDVPPGAATGTGNDNTVTVVCVVVGCIVLLAIIAGIVYTRKRSGSVGFKFVAAESFSNPAYNATVESFSNPMYDSAPLQA